jgi:putative Holliday junction resolvase
MNLLALDIGLKRTGVSFCNDSDCVVVSLETIKHNGFDEILAALKQIMKDKSVDSVVLGYPLLLSGEVGEQCEIVIAFSKLLEELEIPYSFVDERFTSNSDALDKDASAAVSILSTYLELKS